MRKSDHGFTNQVFSRVGHLNAMDPAPLPFKAWVDERAAFKRNLAQSGRQVFSTEGKTCECGRVALWTWQNKGYCRQHKPENVRKL